MACKLPLRPIPMLVAHSAFLTQVRSIEQTVAITEHLVAYGQAAPGRLSQSGVTLRHSVRGVGVAGMQPILDGTILLLAAAFEQFVTAVIVEVADNFPSVVPVYQSLPNSVRSANERYTGEALQSWRRRFGPYNLRRFVDNLRDCQAGKTPYVLNGEAMALNLRNLNPGVLQDLMSRLGINDIWAEVSATPNLKRWSGRGGAKVAQSRAKNRLAELVENRNRISHGIANTTLGPEVIRDYIRFQRVLSRSMAKSIENYADSF